MSRLPEIAETSDTTAGWLQNATIIRLLRSPSLGRIVRSPALGRIVRSPALGRIVRSPALGRIVRSPALGRRIRQLLRYGTVSLISTVISLAVLGALVATSAMPAAWANVVATAVGTAPSFELNRRWVWGHTGQRSMSRQVVPFFAMSFAGLGLSTLFVAVTSHWAQGAGLDPGAQALVAQCANLAGFGSLWLLQFVILDRVLFAHRSEA